MYLENKSIKILALFLLIFILRKFCNKIFYKKEGFEDFKMYDFKNADFGMMYSKKYLPDGYTISENFSKSNKDNLEYLNNKLEFIENEVNNLSYIINSNESNDKKIDDLIEFNVKKIYETDVNLIDNLGNAANMITKPKLPNPDEYPFGYLLAEGNIQVNGDLKAKSLLIDPEIIKTDQKTFEEIRAEEE